jgi:CRISPR/Cas system-associated exonuclease Cas4 (RecB family)
MKKIETLIEDIHQAVDTGFEPDMAHVDDLLFEVSQAVIKQFSPKNRHDRNTLRMSNIGKAECQLWYEVKGTAKEPFDATTRIKFLFGDIIEALIIYLAREAGHEVTDEQKEVKVEGITGHMDCKVDGVTVDIKSASSAAFKKFNEGTLADNDPFGYLAQISGYVHAEGEDEGGFIAMDKQLGKLTYMPVHDMDMIDVPTRIKHLKEVTESDTPPDRCFDAVADGKSGNMKLGVTCSYCAFKDTCWKDANNGEGLRLFLYSNGPRWLTNVERVPDVHEVTDNEQ